MKKERCREEERVKYHPPLHDQAETMNNNYINPDPLTDVPRFSIGLIYRYIGLILHRHLTFPYRLTHTHADTLYQKTNIIIINNNNNKYNNNATSADADDDISVRMI